MIERPPPRFYGIQTYCDPAGIYFLQYPSTWTVSPLADERDGVLIAPEPTSPNTWISAWKSDLGLAVVAEDLPDLRAGLEAGLAQVGDSVAASEEVLGNLVKLERIHTFAAGGARRKRRQWVLYVDHWQISLVYQGATLDDYNYWLAMANYSFFTFDLPTELWFATDRELSGLARPSG
jgi:hypothetical protein